MVEYGEIITGAAVKVTFDQSKGVAYWRPHNEFSTADFNRKIQLTEEFNRIIHDAGVKGIYPLNIIVKTSMQATTELVRGVDMTFTNNLDELVDFLTVRSPYAKLESLIAYLRAIDVLNKQNIAFADHKPDSIFYPYNTPEGGIVIVDVDGMRKQLNPTLAWKIDQQALTPQSINTFSLEDFFTKGITVNKVKKNFGILTEQVELLPYTEILPTGVALILRELPNCNSAAEMVSKLQGYRNGSYRPKFNKTDPLDKLSTKEAFIEDMLESVKASNTFAGGLLDLYT